ncbi:pilus assembly protein TadG-related protein [Vibrio sinaloensis]|uniref:pilus assembly protein TadG-related protein n=1 Tax=Photobacterium sp. (strain ATCC 43367) TaxID=379097 RepID=UPI0022AF3032|nr:pilus assembly protein TadG-related protein [Vibrio sinaloensis]MCZ4295489.1 pilus assembly protein TadG-related protein [Vibrio sinaloensis]
MRVPRERVGKYSRQKGLVLVMVTVAMLALVGVAALSIDVSHAVLNKARLQNSVDAAALAAAIVMDSEGTNAQATTAANSTLNNVAAATGNSEMDFSNATVTVEYSNDPTIFPQSSGYNANLDTYVRVTVSAYSLDNFFAYLFGVDKQLVSSAVAGPSPGIDVVNVVPMAVCEGDSGTGGSTGYDTGELYALKIADQNQSDMGSGNYQLLDFGSGADTVRKALAGGYEGSVGVGDTVITKPGNTIGPVGQGLNTRFGAYSGGGLSASDFPSDIYVKEPDTKATLDNDGNIVYNDESVEGEPWGYEDYNDALPDCSGDPDCKMDSGGQHDRRILVVPIVDCTGASGGTSSFTVTALGCFFMLQKAPTSNSGKEAVFGEFISDCTASGGNPGQDSSNDGPYTIVLYKDPGGDES